MYRRVRILSDYAPAGENLPFAVELAHLIGFHSTFQTFPITAEKAEARDILYFQIVSEAVGEGIPVYRADNLMQLSPRGTGFELFSHVNVQFEAMTGWHESPRKMDLAPGLYVPASDSPMYDKKRPAESLPLEKKLFSEGYLLSSGDGTGLNDTESFRFAYEGELTKPLVNAMCSVACRFGMETSALVFPLLDNGYTGSRVVFREAETSGLSAEEADGAITVRVDVGPDGDAFIGRLCALSLEGEEEREKDLCLFDIGLGDGTAKTLAEKLARVKQLQPLPAGEGLWAFRLLPQHEGYLSRTRLIEKNPVFWVSAGVGTLLQTLKTILSQRAYDHLPQDMNMIFLLSDEPPRSFPAALSERWMPDAILLEVEGRVRPRASLFAASDPAYRANTDLMHAWADSLQKAGCAVEHECVPSPADPDSMYAALRNPSRTAVEAVLEMAGTFGESANYILYATRFLRNTLCAADTGWTKTGGVNVLHSSRKRPVISNGVYPAGEKDNWYYDN